MTKEYRFIFEYAITIKGSIDFEADSEEEAIEMLRDNIDFEYGADDLYYECTEDYNGTFCFDYEANIYEEEEIYAENERVARDELEKIIARECDHNDDWEETDCIMEDEYLEVRDELYVPDDYIDFKKLQYFILTKKDAEQEEIKKKYEIEELQNDIILKCFYLTEAKQKLINR